MWLGFHSSLPIVDKRMKEQQAKKKHNKRPNITFRTKHFSKAKGELVKILQIDYIKITLN